MSRNKPFANPSATGFFASLGRLGLLFPPRHHMRLKLTGELFRHGTELTAEPSKRKLIQDPQRCLLEEEGYIPKPKYQQPLVSTSVSFRGATWTSLSAPSPVSLTHSHSASGPRRAPGPASEEIGIPRGTSRCNLEPATWPPLSWLTLGLSKSSQISAVQWLDFPLNHNKQKWEKCFPTTTMLSRSRLKLIPKSRLGSVRVDEGSQSPCPRMR